MKSHRLSYDLLFILSDRRMQDFMFFISTDLKYINLSPFMHLAPIIPSMLHSPIVILWVNVKPKGINLDIGVGLKETESILTSAQIFLQFILWRIHFYLLLKH